MSGQWFILVAVVGLLAGALPVLLRYDARRAQQRRHERLGGWVFDRYTGKVTRSPLVPPYTVWMIDSAPRPAAAERLGDEWQDGGYVSDRNDLLFRAEQRIAMSVMRPSPTKIVTGDLS